MRKAVPRLRQRVEEQKREIRAHRLIDGNLAGGAGAQIGDGLLQRGLGAVGIGPGPHRQVRPGAGVGGVKVRHQEPRLVGRDHQQTGAFVRVGMEPQRPVHVGPRSKRDQVGTGGGHAGAQGGKAG